MSINQNNLRDRVQQYKKFKTSRSGDWNSEQSVKNQMTSLNQFVEWFEGSDYDVLNPDAFEDYYYHVDDKDYRPYTVQGKMGAVRAFVGYLEDSGKVEEGLRDKVHIPSVSLEDQRSDNEIAVDRVQDIIAYLDKYHYASKPHAIMLTLFHTGIRAGTLRGLDLDDFQHRQGIGPCFDVTHRESTPLKNREKGERIIGLRQDVARVIKDYVDSQRHDVVDDEGREPLFTSPRGRLTPTPLRRLVYKWTCPLSTGVGECDCTEKRTTHDAHECNMSEASHAIRSAAITHMLRSEWEWQFVSGRVNASIEILKKHYDRETKEDKAMHRVKHLDKL